MRETHLAFGLIATNKKEGNQKNFHKIAIRHAYGGASISR
jgi:hypothetical protein